MKVRVLKVFLVSLVAAFLLGNVPVSAASPATNLKGRITANSPEKISLKLTNISDKSCQIVTGAAGTTAVTLLKQAGAEVKPVPLDVNYNESLDYLMAQRLKTLQPGDSATINLETYKTGEQHYLRTVTWAPGVGELGSLYYLKASGTIDLTLNYAVPIAPSSGAPACNEVSVSTLTGSNTSAWPQLVAGAAAVLLVLVILWLVKKRKVKTTAAVLVMVIGLAAGLWQPAAPVAYADIEVPSDMRADFDACMATLEANRDITGPVLDVINDPSNHIHLVSTSGGSESSGIEHNYWIYWDTGDHHDYFGTGGMAEPCDTLYHEMYHIYEQANHTFSMAPCADSTLPTKEVTATRAQNALRERLGLPARSHYGRTPLPAGDCSTPPPAASCTGSRCGDTNGDPHLRTMDGLRYDFQAAGEFTAVRSTKDNYEIQVRQEPWANSRDVSINSAIAMKLGKDKLELRAGSPDIVMLVNGKSVPLKSTVLPDGCRVDLSGNIAVVTWKDGSQAWIRPVGSYGLHLAAQPSDERAGNLEGLLGDGNGESNNDLRKRGETKTIKPVFNELYPSFADSWRINDMASLFTYEKGKSTKTYTDRSFPDKPVKNVNQLSNYAMAKAFCQKLGITDQTILDNCILDVAITGQAEFGAAAVASQYLASSIGYGGTKWSLAIPNSGDTASATFDAKAGEKVFINVLKTNLPSSCGVLELLAPGGEEITSGCIINRAGYIDGMVLPQDGTYTVRLKPDGPTGGADLQLLRIKDVTGAIKPDGPAIQATLGKPGVVARYTFNAKAGQRVYLDIPKSTLKSQCGVARLLDGAGYEITNGCIINGSGEIDTVTIPQDGTYTILIDPNDTVTGTIEMKLILPSSETKTIGINGASRTFNVSKPGSIAYFTFNGTAGQRIFVDIPKSDLPSQCGIISLKLPDGSTGGSGCVINHTGNLTDDGYILPQTGSYTIVFDPNDNATGVSTIRLRSK